MKNYIMIFFAIFCFQYACEAKMSYEERDKLLKEAFIDVASSEDKVVIKGINTIKRYPTHDGLYKLIALWEKDISPKVEKEVLDALKSFEVFKNDDSLILEIFRNNYDSNFSRHQKEKIKRLLLATDSKIKSRLLKKISE